MRLLQARIRRVVGRRFETRITRGLYHIRDRKCEQRHVGVEQMPAVAQFVDRPPVELFDSAVENQQRVARRADV